MRHQEMEPKIIVAKFDNFLHSKGLTFEAIVIGGGALNVMKVIERETIDLDVLSPKIPKKIKDLSLEFQKDLEKQGLSIIENWLNNGPDSLIDDLPRGWETNTQTIFKGKALTLHTLGRKDLLKSKLFAFCDRDERDLDDLKALAPTKKEILSCLEWLKLRDANPDWPKHVEGKIKELSKVLGYEL